MSFWFLNMADADARQASLTVSIYPGQSLAWGKCRLRNLSSGQGSSAL